MNNDKRAIQIIATGIYRGNEKTYPSISACAKAFGVMDHTVKRHLESGKELNGYTLKRIKDAKM